MLWTDLKEIKKFLKIDPTNGVEDANLWFFCEYASQWLGELIGRQDFSYAARTEYKRGRGSSSLNLKYRPVYVDTNRPITVLQDDQAFYGSATGSFDPTANALTYGVDFCLKIDQPDLVTSRSGTLLRINDVWRLRQVRERGYLYPYAGMDFGQYKITYTGGWKVEDVPAQFRLAANTLVAEMRYFFPLGMLIGSESYGDGAGSRSIALLNEKRNYLLSIIMPMLTTVRNWSW